MMIEYFGDTGMNVYALLRTTSGFVINPTTLELDSPTTLDHIEYGLELTEDTVVTGRYTVDIGVGTTATLIVEYWQRLDAFKDRTEDQKLGAREFYWDGNMEWETESLSTIEGGTTINNGGSTTDANLERIERMLRRMEALRTRTGKLG